jgi:hypothetical protein
METWLPKPRWKRHTALSGYLYEYILEGYPETPDAPANYIFLITAGPEFQTRSTVTLTPDALAPWTHSNRPLIQVEQFGIAKLSLLRALDAAPNPQSLPPSIRPLPPEITEICAELDL